MTTRRGTAANSVANTSRTACGYACTCCVTQVEYQRKSFSSYELSLDQVFAWESASLMLTHNAKQHTRANKISIDVAATDYSEPPCIFSSVFMFFLRINPQILTEKHESESYCSGHHYHVGCSCQRAMLT